jgi:hypothetical protein
MMPVLYPLQPVQQVYRQEDKYDRDQCDVDPQAKGEVEEADIHLDRRETHLQRAEEQILHRSLGKNAAQKIRKRRADNTAYYDAGDYVADFTSCHVPPFS